MPFYFRGMPSGGPYFFNTIGGKLPSVLSIGTGSQRQNRTMELLHNEVRSTGEQISAPLESQVSTGLQTENPENAYLIVS